MKPILFSTEMVRAILDGRKTQTRRVINPQYAEKSDGTREPLDKYAADGILAECGKYVRGDILWVRESFCPRYFDDGRPAYKADYDGGRIGDVVPEPKWKPSIHMPRTAARLFLRVTDVRAERVQDISYDDGAIWAEGIPATHDRNSEIRHFIELWDSLNARRGFGWDANPWVWVYEFERISKEEAG